MHPGKLECFCRQHQLHVAARSIGNNPNVSMHDKIYYFSNGTNVTKYYLVTYPQIYSELLYERQLITDPFNVQSKLWHGTTRYYQRTNCRIQAFPLPHYAMIHENERP